MRYRSTHLLRKAGMSALAALLFALGTGVAQAQLPVFNDVDWLLDRGNLTFDPATTSGVPLRQGANNINNPLNSPGHGVLRFSFPRTFDLTNGTTTSPTLIVDNPNAADPQNFSDTSGNKVRTSSVYAMQNGLDPQQMAHAYLNGAWTLPLVPADQSVNDYRSPLRGFSLSTDATQTYSFDYAFVFATHNDFLVDVGNNQTRPATAGELASLPNTSPAVYAGVQKALVNDTHPTATYSSGSLNLLAGNYGVDIYSPGDGTFTGGTTHPNIQRALVRVSWFRTVDANGNIVKANTEDPTHSRIYEVDLSQAGWIHIQGGGAAQAVFPFDGDPRDQIAVTIYSITPDTFSGVNDPVYATAPLVTADAVRFVARTGGSPGLLLPNGQAIAPQGRILGPSAGTNKLLFTSGGTAIADVQPLLFFAREESVPDPRIDFPTDPTQPVSASNPLIADPTATVSAPVFYCIDSQNGNVVGGDTDGFLPSFARVRWRYVGIADATATTTGTSAASPAVANVRCRDGVTRTIVYFMTTDASGALGHIYAFDAAGNRPQLTTQNYWTYPSYRPLTAAELAAGTLPDQFHDPNYKGFNQGPYPNPAFGTDIADPFFHYDGEIVKNPTTAGGFIVRSDTRIAAFGGMQGSPVIIDDPSAPAGGQIFVIGNMNGHVYAFDAGGRGDFNPADLTSTGTTQRIWTWPHFGADAYYAKNMIGTNKIADEAGVGTILGSPSYDPGYPSVNLTTKPILIPAGDGHLYAINAPHDQVPVVNAANKAIWQERRNWVYPALDIPGGLGGALSTAAIFQPAGAAFPYAYFTCNGRTYALQEVPPVIAGSPPTVNTLKWAFPLLTDPNNSSTGELTPGFNGSAPVVMSQATLNVAGAFANSPAVSNDYCYVVQGNSTLYGLNAFDGTVLASGTTTAGASTSCSPIPALLFGLPNDTGTSPAESNPQPTIVFSDDNGGIYGLAARPNTALAGPQGGFFLQQTWDHHETLATRNAAASLVNGLIVEGDQAGQLRAYGVGTGLNGLGSTAGPGEPAEISVGAGELSIDMRVLDFYTKANFDKMMLTAAGGVTANRTGAGGGYTNSVLPAKGNVSDTSTTGAYAVDWGEYVYVAAAGVYHAQPTDDPANPMRGTGPPTIQVTFNITLPNNRGIMTQTITVPVVTHAAHAQPGELWPDDLALTAAEHAALQIYGTDTSGTKMLTGPSDNVYPWIAKAAFLIDPNASSSTSLSANYPPGTSGYTVTAQAALTQAPRTPPTVQPTYSNTLRAGQTDYAGLVTGFPTQNSNPGVLGKIRTFGITNPIAVTTRGITNTNDMTGTANRNVIGLFPSINSPGPKPANVGELLNNGNGQAIPGITALASPYKSIFAPLPMVPDGATSTYSAIDNFGNQQSALFIVDRSNVRNTLGRSVQVQIAPGKINWHGWGPSYNPTATGSAVMNPLPWEQLPTDGQDSLDYPSIPTTAFTIQKATGEDAINGRVALTPPTFPSSDGTLRQLVPTPFNLQVKVPRYQPANVNYGVHTFNGVTFGSAYMDFSGTLRGDPSGASDYNKHILGPLFVSTGNEAQLGTAAVYPAGGYISNFEVQVIPSGVPGQTTTGGYSPVNAFNRARRAGAAVTGSSAYASREVEVGIAVPPGIKMRVAETTLDVGKVPHGTGYTPLTNLGDARSFQVPFAPDMTLPTNPATPGPYWDNPDLGGEFFRPFTLYNESNVNLVDVRVAKLLGQNFSQISGKSLSQYTDIRAGNENTATAASLQLTSDQVNSQSISPLYAVPFKNVSGAPGVGNAGMVSSFDHISINSNPMASQFPERALWPLPNPFVAGADIVSANQNYGAMLPTANNVAAGIMGWVDGLQPQPTVGKPRVGDAQGRTATIPDQPYSGNAAFQRPRVGIAIPLGTPVGSYSAPVYAFEDNTPIQWQEWLSHYGKPAGVSQNYPVSHDGILNVSQTGSPSEPHSEPTFTLKVAVREAKLSREPTTGDLSMLDPFGSWNANGFSTPPGSDNFPTAYMAPGTNANVFNRNLFMYWSTNRRPSPDNYIGANGLPKSYAPYSLGISTVPAPYSAVNGTNIVIGDFDFANQKGLTPLGAPLSAWWNGYHNAANGPTLYDAIGNVATLFPSVAAGNTPFLPGQPNVDTIRLVHPAVAASVDFSGGYGVPNPNDKESYLFWQGQVDKVTGANGGNLQTRDSRISWMSLGGATPGVPTGPIYAMPDDPGLTKLAPTPLLVKLPAANGAPAQKFLYVFWHAGNQSNASIYYNAMVSTSMGAAFDNTQWLVDANKNPLGDTKLPTPGALVWQSDPAPVYRHIQDPNVPGQYIDVVDVVYTGVLKGRQSVETLLSRYKINRTPPTSPGDPAIGSLTLIHLPNVVHELMTRIGNTNTYQARDAAWELGTGPLGTLDPVKDKASQIAIYHPISNTQLGLLNPQAAPNAALPQLGKYDQASGLLSFDSALGGQIIVDMRSGTLRFPQVAPGQSDAILVDYIPFVMRLNTSRDNSNIDPSLAANFGNLGGARALQPTASITSSGNNISPVVIFDRGLNPRTLLTAPQVVFPNGANPTLDRMWVLYRKNDPSGVTKSTIYYKSMRLMVKLPYPVLLTAPAQDGSQQISNINVKNVNGGPLNGPFEVDFVRGRIYFTEADENSQIVVNYDYSNPVTKGTGNSGNLVYRVAWGDEISASIQQGDQTTPEVALPTDSAVSEGQVSAFKDPFLDKLWVFWSSTRAGSTDLYFETIAPQFYPTYSNQR